MQFFRFLVLPLASFSIVGCTKDNGTNQAAIQTIESTVQMPGEARPLSSYERYYTRRPDGTIIGVYTNHDEGHRREVRKTCAKYRESAFPCPVDSEGIRLVEAGHSVWLEEPMDLPAMSGGGCGQVTVEYNPSTERFARVECNGPY